MANRDLHWRHKYEEAGLLKPRGGRTLTQKRALYKEVTEEEWGPPLMTYEEAQAARVKALGGPAEFADWDAYEKATARMLELEPLQPKRPEPDALVKVEHNYGETIAMVLGRTVGLSGMAYEVFLDHPMRIWLLGMFAVMAGIPNMVRDAEITCMILALLVVASVGFVNINLANHTRDRQQAVRSAYRASCERSNQMRITLNKTHLGHHLPLVNCRAF